MGLNVYLEFVKGPCWMLLPVGLKAGTMTAKGFCAQTTCKCLHSWWGKRLGAHHRGTGESIWIMFSKRSNTLSWLAVTARECKNKMRPLAQCHSSKCKTFIQWQKHYILQGNIKLRNSCPLHIRMMRLDSAMGLEWNAMDGWVDGWLDGWTDRWIWNITQAGKRGLEGASDCGDGEMVHSALHATPFHLSERACTNPGTGSSNTLSFPLPCSESSQHEWKPVDASSWTGGLVLLNFKS